MKKIRNIMQSGFQEVIKENESKDTIEINNDMYKILLDLSI